jgi:hypothetical protein
MEEDIMKKVKQTIVTLAAILAPIAAAPLVSAAGTCANGYTGPDSHNLCTSTTTYECTAKNENTFTIVNDNTQVSVSGDATSGDNTGSGGALTGSATNSNGVTFNVTVKNAVCSATATVPATETPVTPASQPTPGRGAIAVAAPNPTAPKSLANTSGDSLSEYVMASIVALASAFGLSRVAFAIYSRIVKA